MKITSIILSLTILFAKVQSKDSSCWVDYSEDKGRIGDDVQCCTSDDVKVVGKVMDGSWGYENGKKCAIRERSYNWNLRDKYAETKKEWEAFKKAWDTEYKNDFERIAVTPGEDESKLNFGWESRKKYTPKIRLYDENKTLLKEFTGTSEKYRNLEETTIILYSNKVTAENLNPDSVYYYSRNLSDNKNDWSEEVKFKTSSQTDFTFVFVGDPQIGGSNNRLNYESLNKVGYDEAIRNDAFNWNVTVNSFFKVTGQPNLLLSAGDQADTMGGGKDQEQEYSAYLLPELIKTIPIAPALGNHEVYSQSFRYHFNMPNLVPKLDVDKKYEKGDYYAAGDNYYFKYNNVLVVVIETNYNTCLDCGNFISKAVDAYPETDWRIAVFHHDVYGNGKSHSQKKTDGMRLRACLTGLFDIYKFDIVINGHDHVYTSTKFIKYKNPEEIEGKFYEVQALKKNATNVNPNGTFFITANCSSGSKFLEFVKESVLKKLDYLNNHKQTFTASFGTMKFSNESDEQVKLEINIYDVETREVIDGPYVIVKDKRNLAMIKNDNKCWCRNIGCTCCSENAQIKFTAAKGSWGYENGSWCGSDKSYNDSCWAGKYGMPCCINTNIVQDIDKNGYWAEEDGKRCGILKDNYKELVIKSKRCKVLESDYRCCSKDIDNISDTDSTGLWGLEDNEWCFIERCIGELGKPCCKKANEVEYKDDDGLWGIENGEYCLIYERVPETIEIIGENHCNGPIDGYQCCSKSDIKKEYEDINAIWGIEKGNWCVIHTKNTPYPEPQPQPKVEYFCSGKLTEFNCCSKNNKKVEDKSDNILWGIENNDWCIINDIINASCSKKIDGYECCSSTADYIEDEDDKDGDKIKWGVENGKWCIIDDSLYPYDNKTKTKTTTTTTTTTTKKTTTTTTTTTKTTTTTTTTIPPSPTNCAAKWAQCGGQGFNVPICCESGTTCTKLNDYYYQCL